jgi:hypothetical protein
MFLFSPVRFQYFQNVQIGGFGDTFRIKKNIKNSSFSYISEKHMVWIRIFAQPPVIFAKVPPLVQIRKKKLRSGFQM